MLLAGGALLGAAALAGADTHPPGATARCNDGTYSFSQHHSGTCSHHGGVAVWLNESSQSTAVGRTIPLGPRTKATGCSRGALPDRRCSPGAYYSRLTKAVICASSFRTRSIRNVPQSAKYAVEREYGLVPGSYGRTIEIDHIVPLELGGSNSIANLFPEPGSGAANYHVKDRLENRIHALVCAGALDLGAARTQIASNWEATYERVFGAGP